MPSCSGHVGGDFPGSESISFRYPLLCRPFDLEQPSVLKMTAQSSAPPDLSLQTPASDTSQHSSAGLSFYTNVIMGGELLVSGADRDGSVPAFPEHITVLSEGERESLDFVLMGALLTLLSGASLQDRISDGIRASETTTSSEQSQDPEQKKDARAKRGHKKTEKDKDSNKEQYVNLTTLAAVAFCVCTLMPVGVGCAAHCLYCRSRAVNREPDKEKQITENQG